GDPFDVTSVFEAGIGYFVRAPNNWVADPDDPQPYEGTFVGVPHNGDFPVNVHQGNYTSIGNPYPSWLDADVFISENFGAEDGVTLYFWTNTWDYDPDLNGGDYTGNN